MQGDLQVLVWEEAIGNELGVDFHAVATAVSPFQASNNTN